MKGKQTNKQKIIKNLPHYMYIWQPKAPVDVQWITKHFYVDGKMRKPSFQYLLRGWFSPDLCAL